MGDSEYLDRLTQLLCFENMVKPGIVLGFGRIEVQLHSDIKLKELV